jgi:hypothetical protein
LIVTKPPLRRLTNASIMPINASNTQLTPLRSDVDRTMKMVATLRYYAGWGSAIQGLSGPGTPLSYGISLIKGQSLPS